MFVRGVVCCDVMHGQRSVCVYGEDRYEGVCEAENPSFGFAYCLAVSTVQKIDSV